MALKLRSRVKEIINRIKAILIFKVRLSRLILDMLSFGALVSLFMFVSLASVPAPLINLSAAEIQALREGCYTCRSPIVVSYMFILKDIDLLLSQSSASDPLCCYSSLGG